MPLHLYHKSVLKKTESLLGRLLKIDYNTNVEKRGKFTRIAVELVFSKPLLPKFLINGKVQAIEYEGFPHVCFSCGIYGHSKDTCRKTEVVNVCATRDKRNVEASQPETAPLGPWTIALLRKN